MLQAVRLVLESGQDILHICEALCFMYAAFKAHRFGQAVLTARQQMAGVLEAVRMLTSNVRVLHAVVTSHNGTAEAIVKAPPAADASAETAWQEWRGPLGVGPALLAGSVCPNCGALVPVPRAE